MIDQKQFDLEFNRAFSDPDGEKKVEFIDRDLRPVEGRLYDKEIPKMNNLRTLRLERCNLDYFSPKTLARSMKNLSLA